MLAYEQGMMLLRPEQGLKVDAGVHLLERSNKFNNQEALNNSEKANDNRKIIKTWFERIKTLES
jgi:hypothetical protein